MPGATREEGRREVSIDRAWLAFVAVYLFACPFDPPSVGKPYASSVTARHSAASFSFLLLSAAGAVEGCLAEEEEGGLTAPKTAGAYPPVSCAVLGGRRGRVAPSGMQGRGKPAGL